MLFLQPHPFHDQLQSAAPVEVRRVGPLRRSRVMGERDKRSKQRETQFPLQQSDHKYIGRQSLWQSHYHKYMLKEVDNRQSGFHSFRHLTNHK